MKTIIFLLSFLLATIFTKAQNTINKLNLDMTVKCSLHQIIIPNVAIFVLEDNEKLSSFETSDKGMILLSFDYGHQYLIKLFKDGYIQNILEVSTQNVRVNKGTTEFTLKFEMFLHEFIEGVDFSIYENPIGKIYFNDEKKFFYWDDSSAKKLRPEFDKLELEIEKSKFNIEHRVAK